MKFELNSESKSELKSERRSIFLIIITTAIIISAMISAIIISIRYFTSNAYFARKYIRQAQSKYQIAEYDQALSCCVSALQYDDTLAEAYGEIADLYLEKGEYKAALRSLREGAEKTKDAALAERADALDKQIVMTKWTCYKGAKIIAEAEFDTSGNLTKTIAYETYENGTMTDQDEYTYDAAGNQIQRSMIRYNGEGKTIQTMECKWEYNEAGIIVREHEARSHFDIDNGSITFQRETEANENGRKEKSVYYKEGGVIYHWEECEYNIDGQETKYVHYNGEGDIDAWYEREYNEDGQEIKFVHCNGEGSIDVWYEHEYNKDGQETKSIHYNGEGDIDYWTEFEYDEAGNYVKRVYHKGSWSRVEAEYMYDEDGNKRKYISYGQTGKIETQMEWTYEAGKLLKMCERSGDGSYFYQRECEYDEAGNQIKDIVHEKIGEHNRQCEHEYEYVYDDAGNLIKEITHYENGSSKCEEWSYDEAGTEIGEWWYEYDKDGNLSGYRETAYDHGKMIKDVHCKVGESVVEDEYNYSEDGAKLEGRLYSYHSIKKGSHTVTWYKYKDGCIMQDLVLDGFERAEQENYYVLSDTVFGYGNKHTFICEYSLNSEITR